MARFVERQIDQMEKRFSCVVGFERREDKRPAPPEQQQKYRNSSGERDRVGRRIRLNEPFFGQGHPASAIPQRRLSLQWSKRPILRKNDSALHTFCCSIRLISLTLGTGHGCGRGGLHSHTVGPSVQSDKKISGLVRTADYGSLAGEPVGGGKLPGRISSSVVGASWTRGIPRTGCSKRPSSKAAAEESTGGVASELR